MKIENRFCFFLKINFENKLFDSLEKERCFDDWLPSNTKWSLTDRINSFNFELSTWKCSIRPAFLLNNFPYVFCGIEEWLIRKVVIFSWLSSDNVSTSNDFILGDKTNIFSAIRSRIHCWENKPKKFILSSNIVLIVCGIPCLTCQKQLDTSWFWMKTSKVSSPSFSAKRGTRQIWIGFHINRRISFRTDVFNKERSNFELV